MLVWGGQNPIHPLPSVSEGPSSWGKRRNRWIGDIAMMTRAITSAHLRLRLPSASALRRRGFRGRLGVGGFHSLLLFFRRRLLGRGSLGVYRWRRGIGGRLLLVSATARERLLQTRNEHRLEAIGGQPELLTKTSRQSSVCEAACAVFLMHVPPQPNQWCSDLA